MKNKTSTAKKALAALMVAALICIAAGFGFRSSVRVKGKGEDHLTYSRNTVTVNVIHTVA